LQAYSQFTEGEPFSSLPTCVPTTNHVLHHMMNLNGYWLGEPQLVINLNVSWIRYAWRWILERFPEIHDLAVKKGSDPIRVDKWREHYMPHTEHYLKIVFDKPDDSINFDISKLIQKIKHTHQYQIHLGGIKKIYEDAHARNHPLAIQSVDRIFTSND
jgi:hypothetical protein